MKINTFKLFCIALGIIILCAPLGLVLWGISFFATLSPMLVKGLLIGAGIIGGGIGNWFGNSDLR